MPTQVFVGAHCVTDHKDLLNELGRQCVIVSGKGAAVQSGALADVSSALRDVGVSYRHWDGVTENPPVSSCIEAGRFAREHNADVIVGIGGGSALDAAKAIAVFATNPSLDEDSFYAKAWEAEPLPIVLVGTTAGTGSEVTKVSVLTDSLGKKHSIHDNRLFAKIAFGDSRYTHSCSPELTLSCGVDAIAHATESYLSKKADELSRACAVRAIRLAAPALRCASAGHELTAEEREELYEASLLAGLAINTTGTCFPHNVGYYLTETFGVPHGFASAVFLPDILTRSHELERNYTTQFLSELDMDLHELIDLIESCLPSFDIQLAEEQLELILPRWQDNNSVKNTRANTSANDIRSILVEKFCKH